MWFIAFNFIIFADLLDCDSFGFCRKIVVWGNDRGITKVMKFYQWGENHQQNKDNLYVFPVPEKSFDFQRWNFHFA